MGWAGGVGSACEVCLMKKVGLGVVWDRVLRILI